MRKLKAFFVALCLILAVLILNIPGVNYGHGPGALFDYDNEFYEQGHGLDNDD